MRHLQKSGGSRGPVTWSLSNARVTNLDSINLPFWMLQLWRYKHVLDSTANWDEEDGFGKGTLAKHELL
jgi:hypothetical protein